MARLAAGKLLHIVNDYLGTSKEMFSESGNLAGRLTMTPEAWCGVLSGQSARSESAIIGARMSTRVNVGAKVAHGGGVSLFRDAANEVGRVERYTRAADRLKMIKLLVEG